MKAAKSNLITLGAEPRVPYFFWDCDHKEQGTEHLQHILDKMWNNNDIDHGIPFEILSTKHGHHLIVKMESWDKVQEYLYFAHNPNVCGNMYILNCRKLRLRVTAKYSGNLFGVYEAIVSTSPQYVYGVPDVIQNNEKDFVLKEYKTND